MIHDEQWDRLLVFGGDRSSEGASAETNTGGETNESFSRAITIYSTDSSWALLRRCRRSFAYRVTPPSIGLRA
jgi:hypothetical protein